MKTNTNVALATFLGIILGSCYAASAVDLLFSTTKIQNTIQPSQTLAATAKECTEWKKRNGDKGKEAATDAPSWVKNEGHKPCKNPDNEDGKTFAKRILDVKYGVGNYKTGAASEYSQIQKYGDRSFE